MSLLVKMSHVYFVYLPHLTEATCSNIIWKSNLRDVTTAPKPVFALLIVSAVVFTLSQKSVQSTFNGEIRDQKKIWYMSRVLAMSSAPDATARGIWVLPYSDTTQRMHPNTIVRYESLTLIEFRADGWKVVPIIAAN